jgi:lipopolysaccharide export system permease protein
MKILFRYLLIQFLRPFLFAIIACSTLWFVFDLFDSLDEFVQQKASWTLVASYYLAILPKMMVPVIPMAFLFSTLYALLTLNRRYELVSIQSGGFSPFQMYAPLALLAFVLTLLLFYIVASPATQAEAARREIMLRLKNQSAVTTVFQGVVFRDSTLHRMWYVQRIDIATGVADGIEILQQNQSGVDAEKYFAENAEWTGHHWKLRRARKSVFTATGDLKAQESFPTLSLENFNTPPQDLTYIQRPPEELTWAQLRRYLGTGITSETARLAAYRTQFYHVLAYPLTVFVFMLYALAFGTGSIRRNAAVGVFNAIFVLLAFLFLSEFFLALGRSNRLPPAFSALFPIFLFAAASLVLLAGQFGWWAQLHRSLLQSPAGPVYRPLAGTFSGCKRRLRALFA